MRKSDSNEINNNNNKEEMISIYLKKEPFLNCKKKDFLVVGIKIQKKNLKKLLEQLRLYFLGDMILLKIV